MQNLTGHTLGPYQILEEVGHGGMANVYRALQPSVGREVAIKVLPAHFLQDRTFVERFSREVKIISRLQHPHILPIYDYGEQEGLPYIVMAYMPGGTLADRIRRENALSLSDASALMSQMASGLDYAHEKGVIHRDFKPSNVLLDEKGNVYLSDFGIAKVTEATAQLTGSGIVGTPAYMAPEMSRPDGMSPLIDIYALGVTFYEMLTGLLPFQAETPMGVLMAHLGQPVPSIRERRPDLPDAAQTILERAMAKDPKARYQSAGAAAADLSSALHQPGSQRATQPAAFKPEPQTAARPNLETLGAATMPAPTPPQPQAATPTADQPTEQPSLILSTGLAALIWFAVGFAVTQLIRSAGSSSTEVATSVIGGAIGSGLIGGLLGLIMGRFNPALTLGRTLRMSAAWAIGGGLLIPLTYPLLWRWLSGFWLVVGIAFMWVVIPAIFWLGSIRMTNPSFKETQYTITLLTWALCTTGMTFVWAIDYSNSLFGMPYGRAEFFLAGALLTFFNGVMLWQTRSGQRANVRRP